MVRSYVRAYTFMNLNNRKVIIYMENNMKIGIGIDTGGTYTDAVMYDFVTKKVLFTAKSLTTKEDLSIGITNAIDNLPSEYYSQIELVSLSTTLATNACVENKGGRAKLIFMGAHPNVITKVGKSYGLPPLEEIYVYDSHTSFSGDVVEKVDWEKFLEDSADILSDADSIGIAEVHAMNNGAILEKQARDILEQSGKYPVPIICGHELYSDLNVLQRGASTLLNARLFPIIDTFLDAIKASLKKHGIDASIAIVRSDSTLMSEEFTTTHPVETLLCGPAASVMGGISLTDELNSLVVDMGGTTTDIAVVKDGIPVTATNGIRVGNWKTYVKGLAIDTFGLGGDSAVRFNKHGQFLLCAEKITPLCILADKYPDIVKSLKQLVLAEKPHTHLLHEFFYLVKDISDNSNYNDREKLFCNSLKEHPLSLMESTKAIDTDVYNFDMSRLEREGVVMRAGITPTDIMHIKGDFTKYDNTASSLAVEFMALCLDTTPEQLCDKIYDEVKKKLYINIARLLLENFDEYYVKNGIDAGLMHLIENSYDQQKEGNNHFFDSILKTKATLIGIGAPIHIFLPDVAKAFNTKCVIPEYAQVANAVGALCCKISAQSQVIVKANNILAMDGIEGFVAHTPDGNIYCEELDDAISVAKENATQQAILRAKERGAVHDLDVSCKVIHNTSTSRDNITIFLSVSVVATATERDY